MNLMKEMAVNDIAVSLCSDIVALRYELLLCAASMIGYIILVASRSNRKHSSCKADFARQTKQVDIEEVEEDPVPAYIRQGNEDVQEVIAELLASHQFDRACDVFEVNFATLFEIDLDEDLERRLLIAALKCGRQSLADHLLETSQTGWTNPDFTKQVVIIQKWWRRSAAEMSVSRMAHMHNVLDRMAQMFNELHPFEEENSDDESTCALGLESASDSGSILDSEWDDSELQI